MAAEGCDTRSSESVRACHQKIFIKYALWNIGKRLFSNKIEAMFSVYFYAEKEK